MFFGFLFGFMVFLFGFVRFWDIDLTKNFIYNLINTESIEVINYATIRTNGWTTYFSIRRRFRETER